jgi:hypothetical protein
LIEIENIQDEKFHIIEPSQEYSKDEYNLSEKILTLKNNTNETYIKLFLILIEDFYNR